MIRKLFISLMLAFLSATMLYASTPIETELEQARQEAIANKKTADNLKIAIGVLTIAYIFIYIMGRRRLTKMIYVRNRAIRIALKKAEESDRRKTDFVLQVSHNVRTPLNAISGFAQLLCSNEFDLSKEEKTDLKNRIVQNVEQVTTMIDELHDLTTSDEQEVAATSK